MMKGPSALADLFSVTIGFREHRFALQRIYLTSTNVFKQKSWHNIQVGFSGEMEMSPNLPRYLFVPTTFNFRDHPAGCIAIAAVRETAEMFGQDKPEAK
jgi:hypothetical protein